MSKFRIVRRLEPLKVKYYAQQKWLWWWIDCEHISMSGDENYPNGAENPSHDLQLVKNYVELVMKNKVVYEYH